MSNKPELPGNLRRLSAKIGVFDLPLEGDFADQAMFSLAGLSDEASTDFIPRLNRQNHPQEQMSKRNETDLSGVLAFALGTSFLDEEIRASHDENGE